MFNLNGGAHPVKGVAMWPVWALIVGLLLGCSESGEDPYVLACRTLLEQTLKSPASLEVVYEERFQKGANTAVKIEYDAANSYGAMLRSDIECEYAEPDSEDTDPVQRSRLSIYSGASAASALLIRVTQGGELLGEKCSESDRERGIAAGDFGCTNREMALLLLDIETSRRLNELRTRE